ncbi:hypothetical protein [Reichenbachiella versicolor]|uniref:hypothetical protein n=1 Tax=Reichenbachiella versicolor TaxID=1821036 RepID=UPI000D6DFA92|nr:hypothetical protein [Reichenbachiella versicolor]
MIKRIKQFFQVSSIDLANFSNTSVNTIDSILANRRSYNLEIALALTKLDKALNLESPIAELSYISDELENEHTLITEAIPTKMKKLERSFLVQNEKLQAMISKRDTILRGLDACQRLLADPNLNAKEIKWLNNRKDHLKYLLTEYSIVQVRLLEAKIAGLESEMSVLNEI